MNKKSTGREDIITLPNDHLRHRSKKVGVITDQVKEYVEAMKQAAIDWEMSRKYEVSVALAAIQIDLPLRIVIVRDNFDNKESTSFSTFINPQIVKYEGKIVSDFEGCLSVPRIYGKVPRYSRVKVRATDLNGHQFRITVEDFLARLLQHEVDHTNGKVFLDHIKDNPQAFFELDEEGQLKQLDYEKEIKANSILWE